MIFFIVLLSFLVFSMYYKFSVIKMNVFNNLFLAIVIMLTKLTCLRKFFYFTYIKERQLLTFYCENIYIFQSSRTILLLYAWEISSVLNFSTSKVQENLYNNILLKCKKILKNFAFFFFILVIWQFNTVAIPKFYTVIFMFLTLIFTDF